MTKVLKTNTKNVHMLIRLTTSQQCKWRCTIPCARMTCERRAKDNQGSDQVSDDVNSSKLLIPTVTVSHHILAGFQHHTHAKPVSIHTNRSLPAKGRPTQSNYESFNRSKAKPQKRRKCCSSLRTHTVKAHRARQCSLDGWRPRAAFHTRRFIITACRYGTIGWSATDLWLSPTVKWRSRHMGIGRNPQQSGT